MALQSIKQGVSLPHYWPIKAYVDFDSTYLIDASGEMVGYVFRIDRSATITKVGFRVGAVTTAQTLRISLQTVDGSGKPSGTLYGGSTAGTQASPVANTYYVVTLGISATATVGDYIAIVVEFDGTVGNLSLASVTVAGTGNYEIELPYMLLKTAGTWAKSEIQYGTFCLGFSDGSYFSPFPSFPWANNGTALVLVTTTYNSGSTPDERALCFRVPFSCRVMGYWAQADFDGNPSIVLYEGTTQLVADIITSVNRSYSDQGIIWGYFSSPQILTINTKYYLTIKPTATNVVSYDILVSEAAIMDALPGGQLFYLATRTDAGAWRETTTRRPYMGLLIDQFDDGVGGGGGVGSLIGGLIVK